MKKSNILPVLFVVFGLVALVSTFDVHPAVATPPSSVVLTYDLNTQTLSVTITHPNNSIGGHYIKTVEVQKNNVHATTGSYSSQPADTFTYNYSVSAQNGDVLSADAICSLSGDRTGTLTVGSTGSTNPTQIPGFTAFQILFWISIGVSGIILAWRKRGYFVLYRNS